MASADLAVFGQVVLSLAFHERSLYKYGRYARFWRIFHLLGGDRIFDSSDRDSFESLGWTMVLKQFQFLRSTHNRERYIPAHRIPDNESPYSLNILL